MHANLDTVRQFLSEAKNRDLGQQENLLDELQEILQTSISPDTGIENLQVVTRNRIDTLLIPMNIRLGASIVEPFEELNPSDIHASTLKIDLSGIRLGNSHSFYIPRITGLVDMFFDRVFPYPEDVIFERSGKVFIQKLQERQGDYVSKFAEAPREIFTKQMSDLESATDQLYTRTRSKNTTIPDKLWSVFQIEQDVQISINELSTDKNIGDETNIDIRAFLAFLFSENLDWYSTSHVLFMDNGVIYISDGKIHFQEANELYRKFFSIPVYTTESSRRKAIEQHGSIAHFQDRFANTIQKKLDELSVIPIIEPVLASPDKTDTLGAEYKTDIGIQLKRILPKISISVPKNPLMPNRNSIHVWEHLMPIIEKIHTPLECFFDTFQITPLKRKNDVTIPLVADALSVAKQRIMKTVSDAEYFRDTYLTGKDQWNQPLFCHDIESLSQMGAKQLEIIVYQVLLTVFQKVIVYRNRKTSEDSSEIEKRRVDRASEFYKFFGKKGQSIIQEEFSKYQSKGFSSPQLKHMVMSHLFAHYGTKILLDQDDTPSEFQDIFNHFTSL